jgi:hypothetical protein
MLNDTLQQRQHVDVAVGIAVVQHPDMMNIHIQCEFSSYKDYFAYLFFFM